MTLREIFFALGFEVNQSSKNQAEQSIVKLKNTAKNLLGAIGIGFSVVGITNAIKSCIAVSSEVEEMQNKFDVVFRGMTDDVEAWSQSYADAIGRNKNDIKGYLADQQNLLVGFGMTRAEGAELSKQMTTLALDLSSFANINETEAVNAMTKAVMGETESAKRLGAVLNESTREHAMLTLGLSGTYESLDQLTKMQVNYQAILNQSQDAIGDCERSLGSYRSTLIQFQSKLAELKTMVGQFFMPAAQKILSFGSNGLTMLRDWVQKISDFTDKLGGSERVLAILGATAATFFVVMNFGKIQKGLGGILNLLKAINVKTVALISVALVLALIVEDFIAFMRGENSVIGKVFDEAGIGADNARQQIIKAFTAVRNFLTKIWNGITTFLNDHNEEIRETFRSVWGAISAILGAVFHLIDVIARAIFGGLKAFWDKWGDEIMEAFRVVADFLGRTFERAAQYIQYFADFLNAVFSGDVRGALEALVRIFGTMLQQALDIVMTIFTLIWTFIGDKVIEIKDAIVNGIQEALDWLAGLPEKAMTLGKDFIDGLVQGIKSKISGAVDAVKGFWGEVKGIFGGEGEVDIPNPDPSPSTIGAASNSSYSSRNITQNVTINNQFNGDQAGQQKSSSAMDKAANDATGEMARAFAFAR